MFATEIHRGDGVYVFVPNSDLWSKPVSNLSRLPIRMIDLKSTIKKTSDIPSTCDRLLSAAASEQAVRKDPPPAVNVVAATDAGIVLSLNVWVDTSDFRLASSRLTAHVAAAVADL